MKHVITALSLLAAVTASNAQDTLTYMHYNLLNYGVSTSYCTPTNNDMGVKEAAFRTIFGHVAPDVLTVNEINPNSVYHKRLLDSTLSVLYPSSFDYKAGTNGSGDIHGNGIFFNVNKLALSEHHSLITGTRDIDLYTLYYLDPQLSLTHDTAFITFAVCHLKAGSNPSDETERNNMALVLMGHLDTAGLPGALLLAGDMNLKGSTEPAWGTLVNYVNAAIRFQDPITSPGSWYSNATFAGIHTQSTHTSSDGCAATGGLDDRFDIILANASAMVGAQHFRVVPSSYHAVGNDGQHFNLAINSGTNTAVPQAVADALLTASDHLPVVVRIRVDQYGAGVGTPGDEAWISGLRVSDGYLRFETTANGLLSASFFSLDGRVVSTSRLSGGRGSKQLGCPVTAGIYFLVVTADDGREFRQKLLIR